jgi:hypothetical protein
VFLSKTSDTLLLTKKILSRVLKLSLKPSKISKEKRSPKEKEAIRKDNKNKQYFQIKVIKASQPHKKGVKTIHLLIKKALLIEKVKQTKMISM